MLVKTARLARSAPDVNIFHQMKKCSSLGSACQAQPVNNTLAVLKALRSEKRLSRTDLPVRTGLSAGTITAVVADLIGRGLVVERRATTAGRGRPRHFLEIDADGAIVLGVRLSDRGQLQISFVDLGGRELLATTAHVGNPPSLRDYAERISGELERVITTRSSSLAPVAHAGIALPALVDSFTGVVHFMATFASEPVPFGEIISRRLGVPVTVENDTNCLARAEHWFGRAKDHGTFTLLNVGYAVTSARYASGLPQTGAHGFTPELGHVKTAYGADARSCYCGAAGCASAYSSVSGLAFQTARWAGAELPALDAIDERFERIMSAAQHGNPGALDVLAEAGDHLGRLTANHINSADPGTVFILAPDERYVRFTRAAFEAALQTHALPTFLSTTTIEFACRSEDWQSKGIAALALEKTYLAPSHRPGKD